MECARITKASRRSYQLFQRKTASRAPQSKLVSLSGPRQRHDPRRLRGGVSLTFEVERPCSKAPMGYGWRRLATRYRGSGVSIPLFAGAIDGSLPRIMDLSIRPSRWDRDAVRGGP